MNESTDLESALGHRFSNRALLRVALTHSSHSASNNERLEFLGDGLVDFVVADLLYQRFPELDEGDLTRLRANLVSEEGLCRVATRLKLGNHIILGDGEAKGGGRQRPSILANGAEALFGAVFLDAGFDCAKVVLSRLYAEDIDAIDPRQASDDRKDPKSRLKEYLEAQRHPLPTYAISSATGKAHSPTYEVTCELTRLGIRTTGRGPNRRVAEQQAAESALAELARR